MTWAPCPHGVRTRGKFFFRSVLFENRDLMGVSLLELNQYGFDTLEVSQDLLEETTLNCFRCEASRWHTAGSYDLGAIKPGSGWSGPIHSVSIHSARRAERVQWQILGGAEIRGPRDGAEIGVV